jgi:hypothetical protein
MKKWRHAEKEDDRKEKEERLENTKGRDEEMKDKRVRKMRKTEVSKKM